MYDVVTSIHDVVALIYSEIQQYKVFFNIKVDYTYSFLSKHYFDPEFKISYQLEILCKSTILAAILDLRFH